MATNNNLNVLVEAKKEYIHQLNTIMCPIMMETFGELYNEAKKISKGKKVLLTYQKLLREIVNWNNHMVKQHSDKISNACGWFNDLLAAVFVSYVKIFSSVRLNVGSKKISIKLPSNDMFIHGCYINAAKDIYKDPYIFHDEMTDYEREDKLFSRIGLCVENTIKEMVPVKEILNTYISQEKTSDEFDVTSEMGEEQEDTEDPEIDDEPMENNIPEGAEPDPEVVEPFPTQHQNEFPQEQETKEIDLSTKPEHIGDTADEGVLFPDAPDK